VFILNNGDVWVTDGEWAWRDKPVSARDVYVDGGLIGEESRMMMLDRQRLSQDGFIVALIPVNAKNRLSGEPEIISRGFVPFNASSDLWQAARKEIQQQFKQGRGVAQDSIRETLQNFFYRETRSRPVILPSLIQV
jgi:ribonuclease J